MAEEQMENILGSIAAHGIEKDLADLKKAADERQAQILRDVKPNRWPVRPMTNLDAPPAVAAAPMERLEQAANNAKATLEFVHQFADFVIGGGNHPAEPETKPPMGMLPTVAHHADTVLHCMEEIRRLVEKMRAAA
jgi:hypothetical protein